MSAIIPVFIPHVGCPHECVFCNQRKIAGTVSAPSAEDVKSIIAEGVLKNRNKAPAVAFYGGSFTAIDENLMDAYLGAAGEFLKSGEISSVRISTRPDCIDEKILRKLSRAGVRTIELGAQSMDERVLHASGRGHTAEDVVQASRLVKAAGFEFILQMMTHLPESSEESDTKTAEKIAELAPDGVRIYPTVVVRDTYLEELFRAGKYTPCTPDSAARLGAKLMDIFEEAHIPIIRFGLNPTEDLSGGEAICGAYHPALGEMALSYRYLALAEREIEKQGKRTENLTIAVNTRRVSAMCGQKKGNRRALCEKYGIKRLTVRGEDGIADGEVVVRFDG